MNNIEGQGEKENYHIDTPASSLEDAINARLLFLGRYPQDIRELNLNFPQGISTLLSSLLSGNEFRDNVVKCLRCDMTIPHLRLSAEPDANLSRWAFSRLPMTPETREALLFNSTWRFWLVKLLLDEDFRAALHAPVAQWLKTSGFLDHWSKIELKPDRQVVGEFVYSGNGVISGWCANLRDLSETVVVEVLLDGRFIGASHCMEPAPGLSARIGGDGRHAFEFKIYQPSIGVVRRGALLAVRDILSKKPVSPEIFIRDSIGYNTDSLARIYNSLDGVRDILRRIENSIPVVAYSASPLIEFYGRIRESGARPMLHSPESKDVALNIVADYASPASVRRLIAGLGRQGSIRWTLTLVEQEEGEARADETLQLLAPLMAENRVAFATVAELGPYLRTNPVTSAAAVHLLIDGEADFEAGALGLLAERALSHGVAYSDHDVQLALPDGEVDSLIPVFKPDFDPLMLLSYDYLGPVIAVAADALAGVLEGVLWPEPPVDRHDLLLRLLDGAGEGRFFHIASVLYTVRQTVAFQDAAMVPRLLSGSSEAVELWAARHQLRIEARPTLVCGKFGDSGRMLVEPCSLDIRCAENPAVSIIVPTRNSPRFLRGCLESLLRVRLSYDGPVQILVVDHENEDADSLAILEGMKQRHGIEVMPYRGPFNWSVMNNLAAAAAARGDVLVFLNDDTANLSCDWLSQAVGTLSLPGVGVVGARLLYGDGTVQHAGIVTSGEIGAVQEGGGLDGDDGGYLGRALVLRSAAAVTGACMVTWRATFERAGGFDPEMPVNWNDVDFCLAVRKAGFRVVYDPAVCLVHFESQTRGYLLPDEFRNSVKKDIAHLTRKWGTTLTEDPFFNKNFCRYGSPFSRLAIGGERR